MCSISEFFRRIHEFCRSFFVIAVPWIWQSNFAVSKHDPTRRNAGDMEATGFLSSGPQGCYSFWVGGSMQLLGAHFLQPDDCLQLPGCEARSRNQVSRVGVRLLSLSCYGKVFRACPLRMQAGMSELATANHRKMRSGASWSYVASPVALFRRSVSRML